MFSNLLQLPPYLAFIENGGDSGGDGGNAGTGDQGGDAGQSGGDGDQGDKSGKVTFTPEQQAEVNRILEDRLTRDRKARAPKPAPPKAKAKAKDAEAEQDGEQDGEQEAGESDLDRRIRELEEERDTARAEAVRATVAESKEVPAELLAALGTAGKEDLEAFADKLVAWRGEAPKRRPSSSAISRTNGTKATERTIAPGMDRVRSAYADAS